jgi:hypothetical protein
VTGPSTTGLINIVQQAKASPVVPASPPFKAPPPVPPPVLEQRQVNVGMLSQEASGTAVLKSMELEPALPCQPPKQVVRSPASPPPFESFGAAHVSPLFGAVEGAAHKAKSKPPSRAKPAGQPDSHPPVNAESRPPAHADSRPPVHADSRPPLRRIKTVAEEALHSLAAKHGRQDELRRALETFDRTVGPLDNINWVALVFCAKTVDGLNRAAVSSVMQEHTHS